MIDYNEQLEYLFKDWKREASKSENKCDKFFVKDGLMYKSTPLGIQESWHNAPMRVAFLLKDQPQSYDPNGVYWDDDCRHWLKDKSRVRNFADPVFRRLSYLLWGLINIRPNIDCKYEHASWTNLSKCFETIPFAYINTKKQPGGGSLDEKIEQDYLDRFGSYLHQELDILNPNVFVCFSQKVYHWLTHSYASAQTGLIKISGNVYYLPEKNIVILYVIHPSTTVYNNNDLDDKSYYEDFAIKEYRNFINTLYGEEFLSKLQISSAN